MAHPIHIDKVTHKIDDDFQNDDAEEKGNWVR